MEIESSKYQRLKDHISYHFERYLSDDELEEVIYHSVRCKTFYKNIGIRPERIKHNERERAFQEQWLKENRPIDGINSGNGILQDLFIDSRDLHVPLSQEKWLLEITDRERMIVATVIQWLGSNVGMGFLEAALDKCGYKIIEKD